VIKILEPLLNAATSYKNNYLVNGNKYLKRSLNKIAVRDVPILNPLINK